jgi:hypothetical protein
MRVPVNGSVVFECQVDEERAWPSRKSIERMTEAVGMQAGRNIEPMDASEMVKCPNRKLNGCAIHFKLCPVTKVISPELHCHPGFPGGSLVPCPPKKRSHETHAARLRRATRPQST